MREDMARVIVERPRYGGHRARKGRSRPLEDRPRFQGMRRRWEEAGDSKSLNENLKPLRRFLERQVGPPWNKVYSEIAAHLRVDNTVQQHVRDHLRDFVALHPRRRRGRGDGLWYQPLYVDPADGLLKRTDRLPEAKAARRARRPAPKPKERVEIAGDREARLVDGVWYEVRLAPLPEPVYERIQEVRRVP